MCNLLAWFKRYYLTENQCADFFSDDNSLQYSSNKIGEMECSINQDLNT